MNTNETVTVRLIVAADGALRTLDQFDSAMTDSANASVKAGAAVDAMTAHLARMRAAQEAGVPVLKARTAAMSVEERMLNSAMARSDAMARARINAERDISRAVASASNLVVQGKMAEEDAIRAVTAVERSHVSQLNRMIAAQRAAADSAQINASAVRGSADAIQAYNMSSSRNAAESANIAMQFQDIAVSAQMGMSPMMVALQQGTQLSAIFNQMKNPLQALPAAFMSIVNPVSLLTIGFVALSTVGIQWAMSLIPEAKDATNALEEHNDMLDELLKGYGSLREGASEALAVMLKLPEGVVRAELVSSLEAQQKAADEAQARYKSFRDEVASLAADLTELRNTAADPGQSAGADVYLQQLRDLSNLKVTAEATVAELEASMVAARELYNTTDDPGIKNMANDAYNLANEMRTLVSIASNLDTTLRQLPKDIQIRISMSEVFGSAMSDISSLYMDPRDKFTQAREELALRSQAAQETAQSTSELTALASEYQRVLDSINFAEAEYNKKQAEKGANKKTPEKDWAKDVAQFQERIAAQQLEIALVGQSTYEIERQRAAMELNNQAKQAGVAITPELTATVNDMAAAYAQSTVELERMQFQQQQIDQINGALQQGFANTFHSIITGSKSAGEAIGDLLGQLGQLFINQAFKILFAPTGVGGVGFNPLSFLGFANGGVMQSPSLSAYSGGVYDSPQVFAFANGGVPNAGVFGEAGPEAIMPLGRDGQGRLGVRVAANDNGGGAGDIVINNVINVRAGTSPDTAPAIAREVAKELRRQLPDAMDRRDRNPLRRAG